MEIMSNYYYLFIAVAGIALVYCMAIESRIFRFLSMAACTIFGGLGFFPSMDATAAITYSAFSVVFAIMFSTERLRNALANWAVSMLKSE